MAQLQPDADAFLRAGFGLTADYTALFSSTDPASVISTIGTVHGPVSLLLGGTASIRVLVGRIGIRAVLLVSVRKLMKEAGERCAIDVLRGQILRRSRSEAVVLSIAGGLIRIAVPE